MEDAERALTGWCKDCGVQRLMDRELGCCACCGGRHVSRRRPEPAPFLGEAA